MKTQSLSRVDHSSAGGCGDEPKAGSGIGGRNNLLTASRQGCFLRCQRAHYWQCEVGLRSTATSLALKLGTAWHAAMEARWNGNDYHYALEMALATSKEIDAYSAATLGSLLAGYYWYYGDRETVGRLLPEQEFNYKLAGSNTFYVAGKIDGIGHLHDGREVLVESKTTRDSIVEGSDYWLRLTFNTQVHQYIVAARQYGWDISEVIYDVTKKPGIKPKSIIDLDSDGLKIVLNKKGDRVYLKNGKPLQSGRESEGFTVKCHQETPDEYGDRLLADIQSRPEFYFQRREVAILDDEIRAFEAQRQTIGRQILHARAMERTLVKPEDAWPRAVSTTNCKFCSYSSFCLQNISVNKQAPPSGFVIAGFNPELTDTSVNEQETQETT